VLAALLGGLYALGALLTFWYLNAPAAGAVFFPSAGLTLAALLLTSRRMWPLWLTAVAIAEAAVDLSHHLSLFVALGFAAANVVEPLLSATLLTKFARGAQPRRFLVCFIAFAVVIGPCVGGLIGSTVSTIAGPGSFFSTWGKWWLGDAVGVLVVATPILAWSRRRTFEVPGKLPELFGIAGVALALVVVPALTSHESYGYIILPILMWAAFRGGPLGVGLSGFVVGFAASWVVVEGHADQLVAGSSSQDVLTDTQLFIAVTLIAALTLAVEVSERVRAERRLQRTENERIRADLAAMHAVQAERTRIARETHDIVGHALNVMILSGAAARRVLDRDSQKATELLATLEEVGRDAFRDLDAALGLADQSADFAPLKGLAEMGELVDRLVQAGMNIDYTVTGTPRALPRLVDGSAYRIVQESLTNVAKHAVYAHTIITVAYAPGALLLEVSDDGRGAHQNGGSRRGLTGMRERVAVLGGQIDVGPNPRGGYCVRAEIPIDGD
jgi:signal transduction histidine kinase